jgi:hypothetical protein
MVIHIYSIHRSVQTRLLLDDRLEAPEHLPNRHCQHFDFLIFSFAMLTEKGCQVYRKLRQTDRLASVTAKP